MPYQNVSGAITPEQRTAVLAAFATIEANVEFLINLTPEERQSIPKMGNNTLSFVSKAIELSGNNPQFVPPYCDTAEMAADHDLAVGLREFENISFGMGEKFSDTGMAAGSESFIMALAFYNAVKAAAKMNVPGADYIRQQLAERFPGNNGAGGEGEDPESPDPEE